MLIRVIDFETCGLPPKDGQVVEVALVDIDARELALSDGGSTYVCERGRSWSSLVNPLRPIPPEMSAIHHITDDMVAGAPVLDDLMPELLDGFEGAPLFAAHNSRFEQGCAPPWLIGQWICTYRCSLLAWPEAPSHSNQALRYWLKLKFADDPGLPHRALGDAYVTAALLRRLLSFYPLDALIASSTQPALLPRFRFGKHKGEPIAGVPSDYLQWLLRNPSSDVAASDAEDVRFTCQVQLEQRRVASRARSPV